MIKDESSKQYKIRKKIKLEQDQEIYCSRCPYHGGENVSKRSKSWKDKTKQRKQYHTKEDVV